MRALLLIRPLLAATCTAAVASSAFVMLHPHSIRNSRNRSLIRESPLQNYHGRRMGRDHDDASRSIRRSAKARNTNEDKNMDYLRKQLEASWNAESMGRVPTTPGQAAEECGSALTQAVHASSSGRTVFLVDIRLPQYDITAGTNFYDEILAVEFCTALSAQLQGRTQILVRDEKVLKTIIRVLNAREGVPLSTTAVTSSLFPSDAKYESTDKESEENGEQEDSDISDDATPLLESSRDVASFRAQLDRTWNSPESVALTDISNEELLDNVSSHNSGGKSGIVSEKRYRLASFFGDDDISKGPDMIDDVAAAVSANAKPSEFEENIIILSPISKEEMIAVRALVGQYKKTKNIILVNCRLIHPLPRELIGAETVYSILPLIAKSSGEARGKKAPKVVVLRRFPRDWEVYVDIGKGFDLAASVPDSSVPGKQGPTLEWINCAVKRYVQSR